MPATAIEKNKKFLYSVSCDKEIGVPIFLFIEDHKKYIKWSGSSGG